jgi:hypothetical protein
MPLLRQSEPSKLFSTYAEAQYEISPICCRLKVCQEVQKTQATLLLQFKEDFHFFRVKMIELN